MNRLPRKMEGVSALLLLVLIVWVLRKHSRGGSGSTVDI